jgi:hypothetical protein
MAITNDILGEEELCAIADVWHKRGLAAWLERNRIPYVLARSGWPRVHRKALEHAMGVREKTVADSTTVEFNFDGLK